MRYEGFLTIENVDEVAEMLVDFLVGPYLVVESYEAQNWGNVYTPGRVLKKVTVAKEKDCATITMIDTGGAWRLLTTAHDGDEDGEGVFVGIDDDRADFSFKDSGGNGVFVLVTKEPKE